MGDIPVFMIFFKNRCAQDKHKIVSNVTLDHVKAFHRNMFKQPLFIQTLVQGNLASQEASNLFEMVSKTFNAEIDKKFQVPEICVNKIPAEKTKILRVDGFNPKNNNTLITNYYQLGLGTMQNHMLLEVGCQIMEEPPC